MNPDDIDEAFEKWWHKPLFISPDDMHSDKAWFALAFRAGAYYMLQGRSCDFPGCHLGGDTTQHIHRRPIAAYVETDTPPYGKIVYQGNL